MGDHFFIYLFIYFFFFLNEIYVELKNNTHGIRAKTKLCEDSDKILHCSKLYTKKSVCKP